MKKLKKVWNKFFAIFFCGCVHDYQFVKEEGSANPIRFKGKRLVVGYCFKCGDTESFWI